MQKNLNPSWSYNIVISTKTLQQSPANGKASRAPRGSALLKEKCRSWLPLAGVEDDSLTSWKLAP